MLSPFYQFDRRHPIPVSQNALTAKLTSSIERLAIPRYTQEQEMERFNQNYIEEIKLPVITEEAKSYSPVTNRLLTMSLPRIEHLDAHNPLEYPDPFAVKSQALRATVTKRLTELSNPRNKKSKMQEIYNAYKVSPYALTAKCSSRLSELSIPVESKRRSKPPEKKKSKKRPFRI